MATAVLRPDLGSETHISDGFDPLTLRSESTERYPGQRNGALLSPTSTAELTNDTLDRATASLTDTDVRGIVADLQPLGTIAGPETVVVADPLRVAAELLAERLLGLRICRRAVVVTSNADVLKCVADRRSALIVAESRLSDGSVLQLAEELDRARHPARLVVLTRQMPDFTRERLRETGVAAIVDKSLGLATVLEQLVHVASGGRIPIRAINIPDDDTILPTGTPGAAISIVRQLTTRQYEVLLLLAEGLSVKDVAARLELSSKTVDSLKYRLMKMLNFHDRVELTRFAIREGLIDP